MIDTIETQRLIMRSLKENETDKVLTFYTANREFFGARGPKYDDSFYTFEYQLEKIKAEGQFSSKDITLRFYIFKKTSPDKIVGNITISNIVREIFQCGFLGYKIDKEENGKGIATEAVGRVIEFAFFKMNLHRLEANVMTDNLASIRVLEKLKFQKEGFSKKYLKINGRWEDHIRYAIINNQNSNV